MNAPSLLHRTLYEDAAGIAVRLPLGEELGALHPGGCFPLLEDPAVTGRACILGMFVVRPALSAWTEPVLAGDGFPESMYEAQRWCFNVRGTHGSGLIAAGDRLDAYRLALQYGVVDAVLIGSDTVAKEGVGDASAPAYLWQPYVPVRWPRLAAAGPDLLGKIMRLRAQWQRLGVLSPRRYPAQVVVSQSGRSKQGQPDIFDAAIFSQRHPDGSAIEVYVLSSEAGADRLCRRARDRGMELRIGREILALSPPGRPEVLDVAAVPRLLRARLEVRLAEHDGGAMVLGKFAEGGALGQLNLTLMRARSVRDVLAASDGLQVGARDEMLASLGDNAQMLFSGDHRLPRSLRPVYVIGGDGEGIVVTFDVRAVGTF